MILGQQLALSFYGFRFEFFFLYFGMTMTIILNNIFNGCRLWLSTK